MNAQEIEEIFDEEFLKNRTKCFEILERYVKETLPKGWKVFFTVGLDVSIYDPDERRVNLNNADNDSMIEVIDACTHFVDLFGLDNEVIRT